MVVAVVARLPVAAMVQAMAAVTVVAVEATAAVADLAEDPAPRTRVSHARTPVTDSPQASHGRPMHRASAMHRRRESTVNNSARTHAARAWTHAPSHATILTTASLAATCRQVSLHQASLQAVTAAASADHALAAVVAEQAVAVVADAAAARAVPAAPSAADKKKRAL
jgi:hypothetical protein